MLSGLYDYLEFRGYFRMKADRYHIGAKIFDGFPQLHFFLVQIIAKLIFSGGGNLLSGDGAEYPAVLSGFYGHLYGFFCNLCRKFPGGLQIFCGDLVLIFLTELQVVEVFWRCLDA